MRTTFQTRQDNRSISRFISIVLALFATLAQAEWPDRPIKFVVPFAAGGANDIAARTAAEAVSKRLGQAVVIENRPGAGAVVGADYVAKSKPDGYTFLIGAAGVVTNSLLRSKMPYEESDLLPVGMISISPSIIVVVGDSPVNNLKEFVAYAKQQPGGVNFATAGSGSTPHFVSAMLKEKSDIQITAVPYKSGSESTTAIMGKQVFATSESSVIALPYIKAGKFKAIASTWNKRVSAIPNIPTAAEQGFPEVFIGHWAGLFAPKGTAPAIIEKMNVELRAALQSKEVHDRFVPNGIEPAPGNVAAFASFIEGERTRLGRIIKASKMTAE